MVRQDLRKVRTDRHRRIHHHQEPRSQEDQGPHQDRSRLRLSPHPDRLARHQVTPRRLLSVRVPWTWDLGLRLVLRFPSALRCAAEAQDGEGQLQPGCWLPQHRGADRPDRPVLVPSAEEGLPRPAREDLHRPLRLTDRRTVPDVRADQDHRFHHAEERGAGHRAACDHPAPTSAAGHVWTPPHGRGQPRHLQVVAHGCAARGPRRTRRQCDHLVPVSARHPRDHQGTAAQVW